MFSTIRHNVIFDPYIHDYIPIHIIGVGATGSRVFMSLAELGLTNLHAYDFDKVESHNLANQAYLFKHVGSRKVDALYSLVSQKFGSVPAEMSFNHVKVDDKTDLDGIVFILTDTMESRRQIAEAVVNSPCFRIFETRMASTHGNVYHFNPQNKSEYRAWKDTLISDDQGEVSPCGTPISVGPTASIIANLAVWEFMNHLIADGCATQQLDVFFKPMMFSTKEGLTCTT